MFTNWSLRTKLLSVFCTVCLSAAISGVAIYYDLEKIDSISDARAMYFDTILDARDLRLSLLRLNESAEELGDNPNSAQLAATAKSLETEFRRLLETIRTKQAESLKGQEIAGESASLISAAESSVDLYNAFIELPPEQLAKATEAKEAFEKGQLSAREQSNLLINKLENLIEQSKPAFHNAKEDGKMRSLVATIVTIILLIGIAMPIVLKTLTSLNRIREELQRSIREVRSSGDSLSSATSSMASASTESAAAIQESVSAMTEMSSMIAQTVGHTGVATSLSTRLLEKTTDGSRTMSEMESSMHSISQANTNLREINKIIEDISAKTAVINEIVFKTQLLAVNASIEAARAGIHGKGFAVVAGEVSNLATMSGQAASQIRDLLSQSTSKVTSIIEETGNNVRQGEQVCQRATKLFEDISSALEEMTEKVQQINEAAREQDLGVKQTTQAIDQLSQATSVNTSVAHENTTMCTSLQSQAKKLSRIGLALNQMITGHELGETAHSKRGRVDIILDGSESSSNKDIMEVADISLSTESQGARQSHKSAVSITSRQAAQSIVRKFKQSPQRVIPDELDKSA